MAIWSLVNKGGNFIELGERFSIPPILARIIRNRGVVGEEAMQKYLYGTREDLYAPGLLKNMTKATSLMRQYIEQGKKIRIIGDYDVDGICATYILMKGLSALGADVDYAIPHRIIDGYGINEHLIDAAHEAGREVLITCDNGIAAGSQIAHARSLGMSVIVTDHHEVPYEEGPEGIRYILPEADAIVDPKQPGEEYPNTGICGAVVAYKFLQVLCPEKEELLEELLEIAAIATVGDVMDLLDENRIIVKEGLRRLEHTGNRGLMALLSVNGLWGKKLSAYHIGFVIGPCLNATGRLDVADTALELLLCNDERQAALLAGQLKNLNDSRKSMTEQNVAIAVEQLGEQVEDKVLVVYLPECHESLAGIIAGRIKERYYRPTFVITKAEQGLKGSGRSIPGYHMHKALTQVTHLLDKFGGHAMAAGLSLPEENLDKLRVALNQNCDMTEEQMQKKISIDYPLSYAECSMDFVKELDLLEPFGNGNVKPVFAQTRIKVLSEKVMGKNHNVGKYLVQNQQGQRYEMLYFGDLDAFRACYSASNLIKLVFYPSINEYMGRESVQFIMQEYDACEETKP